jgi:hypothetical protein
MKKIKVMKIIKELIEKIRGVKHPQCSNCGKEVEGISYVGMDVPKSNQYYCCEEPKE